VAALTTAQVAAIETEDIEAMSSSQLGALTSAQVAALTTDQVAAIETDDIKGLTTTAIRGLTTDAIEALTTDQVAVLTTAQIAALTTAQIQALETDDIEGLSTAQFAALTTAQVAALTTDQFAVLTTDAVVALTTAQAAALTTSQIEAFTTEQIEALQTADIRAMSMTQVSAFETEDIAVMTGVQLDAMVAATPIVLDLDGNGVSTVSSSAGVSFDLNATGNASKVGWASATDGLLVMDRNGDGLISDGTELFGGSTQTADGQRAGNGYAALAQIDSNLDGIISAADASFKQLQVWVDADQDGLTDDGELKSLADLGILSLDLNAQTGTEVDNGNLLGLVSSYTTTDGQTKEMADVWFSRDTASATDASATAQASLTLSDVLADTAGSTETAAIDSLSAGESTTVVSSSTNTTTVVVDIGKDLLDQQNNTPLI